MSDFFDYREVACPACGHINRRFRMPLLNGRYARRCDHCGVDLATGRFSWDGAIDRALALAAVYFFCSLIGVFVALLAVHLMAWMMLGPRYAAAREGIQYLGFAIGIAGGLAVAERNRRRDALFGAKRVVPDSTGAPAPITAAPRESVPAAAAAPVPESRAAVQAKTARGWYLGVGYLGGAVVGMLPVRWTLLALGMPEWRDAGMVLAMLAGLAAGWAWGRWKHAAPA